MAENSYQWLNPLLGNERYEIVLDTRTRTAKLLKENLIHHYTDHGIDHSDRICQYTERIVMNGSGKDSKSLLNRDELFILILSVLLHDIGMYLPINHGITKSVTDFNSEDYKHIREGHGEVSAKVIRQMITNDNDQFQLGLLRNETKDYLTYIAEVCEKHQSKFEYDPSEIEHFSSQDGHCELRLGLLTALLRISDTLDCDRRRIDIERLNQYEIPIESKLHWYACHYVDAVEINKGLIRIYASWPESISSPVVDYLGGIVITKIKSELEICQEILWTKADIRISVADKIVSKSKEFALGKKPIPDDLLRYIIEKQTVSVPVNVETATIQKVGTREKTTDWMTHWKMIGNPFSDYPLDYGNSNLIITDQFKTISAEIDNYLKGAKGEIRMVMADRGQGKTTLFQYLSGQFSGRTNVFLVDIGDKVASIRNVADLTNFVFSSIYGTISSDDSGYSPENLMDKTKSINKCLFFVDSLDRLPPEQDYLVRDFFTAAQHMLTVLKHNIVVIFSCSNRWSKFIDSHELSYLGARNQWVIQPLSTHDSQSLLEKRLNSSGSSYDRIFSDGCISALHAMSKGNPRKLLNISESICRFGAESNLQKVEVEFIKEKFKTEFEERFRKIISEITTTSKECNNALVHLYTFFLEMEKRSLNNNEGWEYLRRVIEDKQFHDQVKPQYFVPLKFVADIVSEVSIEGRPGKLIYKPRKDIAILFKELKKKGFPPKDFISFYSRMPILPNQDNDDIIKTIKSDVLSGDDLRYFEKARILYDEALNLEGKSAGLIITKCWDSIENMLVAILIKKGKLNPVIYDNKLMEPFWEDKNHVQRYRQGAGKIIADRGSWIKDKFHETMLKNKRFMKTWPSLQWVLITNSNVVKGKSEYSAQYSLRDLETCKNHLRSVTRELLSIYNE